VCAPPQQRVPSWERVAIRQVRRSPPTPPPKKLLSLLASMCDDIVRVILEFAGGAESLKAARRSQKAGERLRDYDCRLSEDSESD